MSERVGKWTGTKWVVDFINGKWGVYADDATGSIVAQVSGFEFAPRPAEEAEANANLIAAAPVMAQALEKAISALSGFAPARSGEYESKVIAIAQAEAALAAARGEK